MSDLPERIWRVKPWSPSQHKHGLASWPIEEQAGPDATEYLRADLHRAEVEAARREGRVAGLREAGEIADAAMQKYAAAVYDKSAVKVFTKETPSYTQNAAKCYCAGEVFESILARAAEVEAEA
jgi:hypothetical protein